MFWTIVGALLFVFVVVPIILYVLQIAGFISWAFISTFIAQRNEKKQAAQVVQRPKKVNQSFRFTIFAILVVAVVGLLYISQQSDNQVASTLTTTPLVYPTDSGLNYNQEAVLRVQAKAKGYSTEMENAFIMWVKNGKVHTPYTQEIFDKEKNKYNILISELEKKYSDKTISSADELQIQNNLTSDFRYDTLKDEMIKAGFDFIGYESKPVEYIDTTVPKYISPSTIPTIETKAPATSTVAIKIVSDLKLKYPDKLINWNEESDIRRNIPSTLPFNTLKDLMIEEGFEFVGFE